MNQITPPNSDLIALQLSVNNHPGVMSHVCGLFARRGFNLEGILVTPVGDGSTCIIWLLVVANEQLDQMVKQVRKLNDVLTVKTISVDKNAFSLLADCMHRLQK